MDRTPASPALIEYRTAAADLAAAARDLRDAGARLASKAHVWDPTDSKEDEAAIGLAQSITEMLTDLARIAPGIREAFKVAIILSTTPGETVPESCGTSGCSRFDHAIFDRAVEGIMCELPPEAIPDMNSAIPDACIPA